MSGVVPSTEHRLRVVFMGTPDFAVPTLQRLLDEHAVVAVYTRPDKPAGRGRQVRPSPVKAVAEAHGVPVLQPRSLRNDPGAVAGLRDRAADVIVVAAYGLLLPGEALTASRWGCLNVHASLLPRWRGAAPITHAIMAGDTVTGVTIMLMDEGMDTGPILAERSVSVDRQDTTGSLAARLALEGADLLSATLGPWVRGALAPTPQDDRLATLAPRIGSDDGRLEWEIPAAALARRVRAMNPWPGAHATLPDGRRLKVHAAHALGDAAPGEVSGELPGELGVVQAVGGIPAVRTIDGLLLLDEVQVEGRRAMPGDAFLRGHRDLLGARLTASDPDRP